MKIINSLGKEEYFSLKDLILRKYTNESRTSESLWSTTAQPSNTCPLINSAQNSNESEMRTIKGVIKDLEYFDRRHSGDESLECCSNYNSIQDNSKLISDAISSLEDASSELELINDLLEEVRSSCENYRSYGQDVKDLIWELLESPDELEYVKEQFEKIKKQKPTEWHYVSSFEKIYDKIKFDTPRMEDEYCKDRCENYKSNQDLVNAFEEIGKIDWEMPSDLEKAIDNLQNIESWASEMESLLEDYILDVSSFSYSLEDEIRVYEASRNTYQVQMFSKLIEKLKMKSIDSISIDSLGLDIFLKNNENQILVKKIENYVHNLNDLIKEFNSVANLDPQDITAALKVVEPLVNKIEIFTKKTTNEEDQYSIGNILKRQDLYSLRSKIEQVESYLKHQLHKHGPYKFKIQVN